MATAVNPGLDLSTPEMVDASARTLVGYYGTRTTAALIRAAAPLVELRADLDARDAEIHALKRGGAQPEAAGPTTSDPTIAEPLADGDHEAWSAYLDELNNADWPALDLGDGLSQTWLKMTQANGYEAMIWVAKLGLERALAHDQLSDEDINYLTHLVGAAELFDDEVEQMRETVLECRAAHPDWDVGRVAWEVGHASSVVVRMFFEADEAEAKAQAKAARKAKRAGKIKATGTDPAPAPAPDTVEPTDTAAVKFQKTLALAASASNVFEAEAAESAARRLIKMYNINPTIIPDPSLYDRMNFADNTLLKKLRAEWLDQNPPPSPRDKGRQERSQR